MFTLEIICYLYLGGMGGAALALVCGLDIWSSMSIAYATKASNHWEHAFNPRFYACTLLVTAVILGIGVLLLVLDLGQPQRFLYVLTHPTLSILSFGSYALLLSLLTTAFLLLVALFGLYSIPTGLITIVEWIGMISGIGTAVYSGLFLVQFNFIALWANPFVPVLFASSSFSSAVGLLILVVVLLGKATFDVVKLFFWVDRATILLELMSLVGYFAYGILANGENFTLSLFFLPEEAVLFWFGCVGLGMVLPLLLESLYKRLSSNLLLGFTAFCLLLGGFVLRWCIITLPYLGL